jgi:catalase-peroxidase
LQGKHAEYAKAFAKLDLEKVKDELRAVMKDSKEFWPADYGHYGPLFIRMAWHSAGTYRSLDGRGGSDGGQQRFYPLANWPDNANLDKARALIQPVVERHYPNLSWADAMVLAGDVAMQDMGFETLGVAGGRVDDSAPDLVYWGPEDQFLKSERFNKKGELMLPLAASVMGLIYVNPEGPDGKPDPLLSAGRIRTTFGRMGMNDEETVALIAGGHTFGKAHGAPKPEECKARGEAQKCPEAKGPLANTSGIEGSWSPNPTAWTHEYLTNLYKYEWKLTKGPGGKYQWYVEDLDPADRAPDAHDPTKTVSIIMLTTDLALKVDPEYNKIAKRFLADPKEFKDAFAKAWFKLIHRDLGPKARYLGNSYSKQDFLWQDPLPKADYKLISTEDIALLKKKILSSDMSISERVKTAWAAAVTFRGSDFKGGVNGARIRLVPQKTWQVNEPEQLQKNVSKLEEIQNNFNVSEASLATGKKISLADVIVLAGNTAVEEAASKSGVMIEVPFIPGRVDATEKMTDPKSLEPLKITSDGFRNYHNKSESYLDSVAAFVDRADNLNLTKQEMAVLTGGLRVLGANYKNSPNGVLTQSPNVLTNDFFINLLDRATKWERSPEDQDVYVGKDVSTGAQKWTATKQDLIFGTTPDLRLISFQYGTVDAKRQFVADFSDAWKKVMELDRFDLQ